MGKKSKAKKGAAPALKSMRAKDIVTHHRLQHNHFATETTIEKPPGSEVPERSVAKKVTDQIPIDVYRNRAQISEAQYEAAKLLLQKFTSAGIGPRVTGSYSDARGGGGSTEGQRIKNLSAYADFQAMIRYAGITVSEVLVTVVCYGDFAGSRERLDKLRDALSVLAFGMGVKFQRLPTYDELIDIHCQSK